MYIREQQLTYTTEMNQKPLVIYHSNCADGFSAAWCFWHKYREDFEYIAAKYDAAPPPIENREVYLVDFSYKRSVIEQMLKQARSVTLIDHHKSALEDLHGLPGLKTYTDLNRSGATLAWDFLFPNEPRPALLGHIEDYDLWRFKLEGTRPINKAVFAHEFTFENWDKLMAGDTIAMTKLMSSGDILERKHRKDLQEIITSCQRTMEIGGYTVPAINVPHTMASDAGNILSKGQPFAACYHDMATGRKFSLRSHDDGLDVTTVAALFGGGGHARAAGFTVPREHPLAQA